MARQGEGGLARRAAEDAVSLLAVALFAAWVIAWLPVFPCVLLEHFRVQYVELGILVALGAAALRLRGYFDLAVIATLLHALPVATDLSARPQAMPAGGIPIRVLELNVHTESSSFARVRQLIADEHPDLIGLVEVDRRWIHALAPALAGYTGRIEAPRSDNFGVALYARGQLAGAAVELGSALPSVVGDVTMDGAHFEVILTHPIPPMSAAALADQRDQLDAVADRARAAAGPVLVLGDLNATPWSGPFRRLRQRSGLCDSRAGFGIEASFPAWSWLRIPIDHLLASCAVGVRDRRIGPDVGSDHLPVIVDLVVPAP